MTGPYTVSRYGKQWAVSRPNSGVLFSIRKTRKAAEETCAKENAEFARRQIELAAPDMLRALKAVEEWWLSDGMKRVAGAPFAMFATRAAIAKAEGREI